MEKYKSGMSVSPKEPFLNKKLAFGFSNSRLQGFKKIKVPKDATN